MPKLNLTEMAKKSAKLVDVTAHRAQYAIDDFRFDVPLNDVGEGKLLPEEKGISLMRWLRPAIQRYNEGAG